MCSLTLLKFTLKKKVTTDLVVKTVFFKTYVSKTSLGAGGGAQLLPLKCSVVLCVIAGFRREVDENYALLGYCAAGSGNFLPTFPYNLSVPSSSAINLLAPEFGI